MSDNYYTILGVSRDADEREIKRAYHKLARELHPDKADTPEKAREMEQAFATVSTAYNLLKDLDARREYDRKMFGDTKAPSPVTFVDTAGGPGRPAGGGGTNAPMSPVIPDAPRDAKPAGGMGEEVSLGRQAIAQKACVKGMQLMKQKDYAKASEFFEAAISNNPNEANYHSKYALALIEAKKSGTKAIEAAQKAIELDKYNVDYKFNLANIYTQIGSKTNAIKVYEDILKWDKDNKAAKQMLRQMQKTGGMMEKMEDASPIFKSIAGMFKKKD